MRSIEWQSARAIAFIAPCGTIDPVVVARTFGARAFGLLARASLHEREGMLFVPGGSVHTLGMRFALDIVFLSERFEVIDLAEDVPPWRFALAPRRTRFVLELRTRAAREVGIVCGSTLEPVANCKQPSSCVDR